MCLVKPLEGHPPNGMVNRSESEIELVEGLLVIGEGFLADLFHVGDEQGEGAQGMPNGDWTGHACGISALPGEAACTKSLVLEELRRIPVAPYG